MTNHLSRQICHCGAPYIKSKVNNQCYNCDMKKVKQERLLREYQEQKLMLHLAHLLNYK